MSTKKKIKGTCEAWEDGFLGREAEHAVKISKEKENDIEEALGMKMISIRLPADLIQAFKDISEFRGVSGYQPLMRDALKRFADSEMKIILAELAEEKRKSPSKKAA
ncbi:hypothetical protein OFAG_00876 [Oxalobacter formigenes HOxBLS]|uniref:Uncharacterized protein n=1 Tax=Oxalobacter paraformigenes TaxID=556268 RepID=C3X3D7_9BURK|nr:hypothetical protein OFAG_00876 [Oxalobacter paraformigenes]